ncbi:MAG: 16S rRNA (cytosine(1402)-N(4))-methyltransferase RsmH [Nitrospinota bacterium]|nr:16S rRNA (cytosine(1402)-N(4))-methyltransferase RsmH [Nitrospinota bacterium]
MPASLSHHKPVLAERVIHYMDAGDKHWIVDGTLGDGGHAELILKNSGPQCRVLGIDRDAQALARARKRLASFGDRIYFIHGNFSEIKTILMQKRIEKIDGFLIDAGLSSMQLDTPDRGFSFTRNGPLDMRMNRDDQTTAAGLLARLSDVELQKILKEHGEERHAKRIVRAIRKAQDEGPIETTAHLSHAISETIPNPHPGKIHPATRTFQALRIAVNHELDHLKQALKDSLDVLNHAGRLLAISFHSLEDRIVKQFFKEREKGCVCPPEIAVCICGQKSTLKILTRRPVRPSASEVAANPRASSGKLRAAERIYV